MFEHAAVVDALAPAIHETWRRLSVKEGWTMPPHLDRPYAELAPGDQGENLAAARRIPEILGLAGLGLAKVTPDFPSELHGDDEIRQHLERQLERLSEAEHDGWMAHRVRNGWRYHETRDDERKLHPSLVPYATLTDAEKKKDRNSVRHFPDMVRLAGYRILLPGGDS